MRVDITITAQPIELRRDLPAELAARAGAVVEFAGLVRGEEGGQPIAALEYEAYSPMAENLLHRIVRDLAATQPCLYVRVTHRVGLVPVGEAAIQLVVASSHRAEAFALATGLMDRLKEDVPIWKCRALTAAELQATRTP